MPKNQPVVEAQAETNDKEEGCFSANELLGCSDERKDEIVKAFRHAMIDHDTWQAVVKEVIKTVKPKTDGEHMFVGYIFGRKYEEHDNAHNPMSFIEHLLKH